MCVMEEVVQSAQQKRPKTASAAVRMGKGVSRQEFRKKCLRQVVRCFGIVTATPDMGVEREPIALTQRRQSGLCTHGLRIGRCKHDTPVSGRKDGSVRWPGHTPILQRPTATRKWKRGRYLKYAS